MTLDRYYVAFEAWGMVTLWKGPRDCAMGTLRCASSVPALGEAVCHSYMSQWGQGGCWSAEVDHCVYPANNSSGSSVQEWASAITISLLNSFLSCSQHTKDPGETARMELGPTTETFVLELRCLEDGSSGPDTLSGEGWGGGGNGDTSKDSVVELQAGTAQATAEGAQCGQQRTHSYLLTSLPWNLTWDLLRCLSGQGLTGDSFSSLSPDPHTWTGFNLLFPGGFSVSHGAGGIFHL